MKSIRKTGAFFCLRFFGIFRARERSERVRLRLDKVRSSSDRARPHDDVQDLGLRQNILARMPQPEVTRILGDFKFSGQY